MRYQNKLVTIPKDRAEEIGYLKKTTTREICLDDDAITDSNFNRAGFKLCFKIFNRDTIRESFKENPGDCVSALAVAHYLEMKTVMTTCGCLMKANIDETVSLALFDLIGVISTFLFSNRTA